MDHWNMFSVVNSTDSKPEEENEDGWKYFLGNNTEFILPLDYVRDMAVEEPGESPVLVAKFGKKGKLGYKNRSRLLTDDDDMHWHWVD